jgi:hypothetical protein
MENNRHTRRCPVYKIQHGWPAADLHVLDFLFEDDEDDLHGTDDDVVTLFGPLLVKML